MTVQVLFFEVFSEKDPQLNVVELSSDLKRPHDQRVE